MKFDSLHAEEFFPKCTHKERITVVKDGFRNPREGVLSPSQKFEQCVGRCMDVSTI